MQRTPIQWTEFTNNHLRARLVGSDKTKGGYDSGVGHHCVKVGPDCKNCYSSEMQPRFGLPVFQEQRNANVEVWLDPVKLAAPLKRRAPSKIFWCDMTDLFGDWVTNEQIAATFGVMAATPQHTHQILTKRAKRMREWFDFGWVPDQSGRCVTPAEICRHEAMKVIEHQRPDGSALPGATRKLYGYDQRWPLPNVHVGVSAGNQKGFDERWHELRTVPAAVRWFSVEPQLELIDARSALAPAAIRDGFREVAAAFPAGAWPVPHGLGAPSADWIVCGGESGDKARPFDLAWARGLRDQCAAAGVPFFMKQIGAITVDSAFADRDGTPALVVGVKDSHGGDPSEWPENLRVREFPIARTE